MLTIIAGCKSGNNAVAIRDFSKTLQPYLVKIVSTGIVSYAAEMSIKKHATDKELEQLSRSESPVLRAVALRNMLTRPSFNHYDVVMAHLDDTAIVFVDHGEWGIKYEMVSDDMLMNSMWKDTSSKIKVIKEIVLHHNFLRQAYHKAAYLSAEEKYYKNIKEMALKMPDDENENDINFEEREDALYALARYKKKEDIPSIKEILETKGWRMSDASFDLLSEYPDTSYLSVYEKYYRYHFYSNICDNWGHSVYRASGFIKSLASYKNERSAKILMAILNKKPFVPCRCDVSTLERTLAHAIADNMCEAYKGMTEQVNKILEEEKRNTFTISYDQSIDTVKYPKLEEPIRW